MTPRKLIVAAIGLFALILLGGVVYWQFTPTVTAVSPDDGSTGIPASSAVSITFSREMQHDSVEGQLTIRPDTEGSIVWQGKTMSFIPDQPWQNGQAIEVQLNRGGRASGALPLPAAQDYSWRFVIGDPRLVYLYPSAGPANIHLLDLNTGEIDQLTSYPGGIIDYSVNRKGNIIYFSIKTGTSGSSIFRLDLQDQQGGDPVEILSCPRATCREPVESPSGEYLAYERTASVGEDDPPYPQVWIHPLPSDDPSPSEEISEYTAFKAGDSQNQTLQPHWSPAGLLTYYDTNQSAFVMLNLQEGQATLFPNQTGQPGSWHPSGASYVAAEIFFTEISEAEETSSLDRIGSSHLISFTLADQSSLDLTIMDNLEDTSPAYSPDGNRLAFARKYLNVERWTPGRQMWVKSTDGSDEQQLTNDPYYNHYEFTWSPTGDLIAYVRFNQTQLNEPPEIWIIDPATTLSTRQVEAGYAPQWIP